MKTIRTNCFETNSSSTHSLTLHSVNKDAKLTTTFLPDENGGITTKIQDCSDLESTIQDRLSFLISWANFTGVQENFDRVVKVVEEFTKMKLTVQRQMLVDVPGKKYPERVWKEVTTVDPQNIANSDLDEDEFEELVSDEFYKFYIDEYNKGSFAADANEIIKDEKLILLFIFSSSGGFSREIYYDG